MSRFPRTIPFAATGFEANCFRVRSIRWVFCLLLASCAIFNGGCQKPQGAGGQERITLALNWLPEAEHGGYYAALLEGYFEEEGLSVEILPGGPDSPVIQRVGARRVTFGVANGDRVALGRAQGAAIRGVLAPLQNSPRCIMVHEESGIDSFESLQNVTLAMSDAPAFAAYLKSQVPLQGVRVVRYTGSIAHFLRDKNYAQQGYVFSEPVIARQQGARPRALMLSDLGFNPYSSLLVVHDDLIEKQPELVEKFVRAARRGWESYLQDSTRVHAHLQQINPEMSVEVLDAGFQDLRLLCLEESGEFLGKMESARWEKLVQQLETLELLQPGQVAPTDLFTVQFLNP